jgi:hypothetical protein
MNKDGLRVSRCSKFVRAITGSKVAKGESPTKLAYKLLVQRGVDARGSRSINQFLDDNKEIMQSAISLAELPKKPKKSAVDFLQSYAWRRLRMEVLSHYGAKCMCCGVTPRDGAVMNVDHIKPRKLFPELALEFSNLQILCNECNHGKGNWNMMDWRPKEDKV